MKDKFMNYIFIWITIATFLWLWMPAKITALVMSCIVATVLTYLMRSKKNLFAVKNTKIHLILSLIIVYFAVKVFYSNWIFEPKVYKISQILKIHEKQLVLCAGIFFALFAMIFVSAIIELLKSTTKVLNLRQDDEVKITLLEYTYLFASAMIIITLVSKSSFLYPLNDWVDANAFFTVGRAILQRKVPYIDLYEHKGPWLYFLHALAAMVSKTTFIGVYIIEILACFMLLLFSYKIIRFYVSKNVLWYMPLYGIILYSSLNFCHGDSVEEFCLPMLAYAFYLGIKVLNKGIIPNAKSRILLGVTSGFVLWTKYTNLGFYLGWIIIIGFSCIVKKNYRQLYIIIRDIVIGIIIISIPVILYFSINGALYDMFKVYFYDNLFVYSGLSERGNVLQNILDEIKNFKNNNIVVFVLILLGVYTQKHRTTERYIEICLLTTILGVFGGGKAQVYYSFILGIYAIYGFGYIYILWERIVERVNQHFCTAIAGVMIVVLFAFFTLQSSNMYLLGEEISNTPQYKFKEIICQKENATLLNYGCLDLGFYNTCNIIPNCKYFYTPNIKSEEVMVTQNQCIKEKKVDFIVTRRGIEAEILNFEDYELIAEEKGFYEGNMWMYYLYQKMI